MSSHTYESLTKLKGQAVKDIWHAMIGKPAGIKNTTGLKNGEEIIQAILKGQADPEFLKTLHVRAPKQEIQEPLEVEAMPPKPVEKKKPGPKPKAKPAVSAPVSAPAPLEAYESLESPIKLEEIHRIVVRKLHVGGAQYFLDAKTNKLYSVLNGRPGTECGLWNPETREVTQ